MSAASRSPRWTAAIPWLFVLLWSSGFIGSKLGVPYAEPFTFMSLRYCIVLVILVPIALVTRAPWPKGRRQMAHVAFAGLLIHALYLGGCVWSLRLGLVEPALLHQFVTHFHDLVIFEFLLELCLVCRQQLIRHNPKLPHCLHRKRLVDSATSVSHEL